MIAMLEVFVVALAAALLLGRPLIVTLQRLAYRQHAYEDAPQTHQVKTGTPTMGGLLFLIAPLVVVIAFHDARALAYAFLIVAAAAIGFADDVMAVRGGRNRGLKARTKLLLTGLVGAAFLALLVVAAPPDRVMLFAGATPLWFWLALSLAVILATTHAVNLTDGLDGLAAGTIVPPLLLLAFVAWRGGGTMTASMERRRSAR